MAKGTVHYELTANEAGAVDAFRKLTKEQQKAALAFGKTANAAEDAGKRAKRSGDQMRSTTTDASKAVFDLARNMLGIGSAAAAIATATTAMKAYHDYLLKAGEAAGKLAGSTESIALGMVTGSPAVRTRALLHGAAHGTTAIPSLAVYGEVIRRARGNTALAGRMAEESFDLAELGMDAPSAARAIGYGAEAGAIPEQVSSMIVAAQAMSGVPWAEMGTAIAELKDFHSLPAGLGAFVALAREMTPERATAALRQLPSALRGPNALSNQLRTAGYNIDDMSDLGVINLMSQISPMDAVSLERAGVSKRAAGTLATLYRQRGTLGAFASGRVPMGLDDVALETAIKADPLLAGQQALEQGTATFQAIQALGPDAARGMAMLQAEMARGARAQERGRAWMANPETGRVGWFGSHFVPKAVDTTTIAPAGSVMSMGGIPVGTMSGPARGTAGETQTVAELRKIQDLLQKQLATMQPASTVAVRAD